MICFGHLWLFHFQKININRFMIHQCRCTLCLIFIRPSVTQNLENTFYDHTLYQILSVIVPDPGTPCTGSFRADWIILIRHYQYKTTTEVKHIGSKMFLRNGHLNDLIFNTVESTAKIQIDFDLLAMLTS